MMAMYVGGYRQHELASIFGVTAPCVRTVLLKYHRRAKIPWSPVYYSRERAWESYAR